MDDSLGPCGIVQLEELNFLFNFLFNFQFYFLFLQTFCKHFSCLSGMPSVSHEGPSLATGEVRQAFGPTLDHFPQSFGSAKVQHKKRRWKEKSIAD